MDDSDSERSSPLEGSGRREKQSKRSGNEGANYNVRQPLLHLVILIAFLNASWPPPPAPASAIWQPLT